MNGWSTDSTGSGWDLFDISRFVAINRSFQPIAAKCFLSMQSADAPERRAKYFPTPIKHKQNPKPHTALHKRHVDSEAVQNPSSKLWYPLYLPHDFASMPSGGRVSTFPLLTSSQFVLSEVPLLSV